jgi:hypothetical protein
MNNYKRLTASGERGSRDFFDRIAKRREIVALKNIGETSILRIISTYKSN